MKLKSSLFAFTAMLALLMGFHITASAAKIKEKNRKHSTCKHSSCKHSSCKHSSCSSASRLLHKQKKCCKKILAELEEIERIAQQDLALDLLTNTIIKQDLAVDQETLDIVTNIQNSINQINSTVCKPISQITIDNASGTLILTESGRYCLTEDVVGSIVIDTDCLCIDLSCYTIDAGGVPSAISSTGHEGIVISNGCVTNASSAGVLFTNCSAVEIADLHMHNNLLDAIRATGTNNLYVHGINSIGTQSGERILRLDVCKGIIFKQSQATGYTSTIGAIVELSSCISASIEDVDLYNNTKTISGATSVADADVRASLVAIGATNASCVGINLVGVKVNNNFFNSTNTGASRRSAAIGFVSSDTCSMHRCEASNNIDLAGGLNNTRTRALFILNSKNFIITELQANSNSCPGPNTPIGRFETVCVRSCDSMLFDGCQASNNFVQDFASGSVALLAGFNASGAPNGSNIAYRNCQANFNRVANGGNTTTISAASNGLTLPQPTINVVSTAGFATSGTIFVVTSTGVQTVNYTGLTATSFTGTTGGTGIMATGNAVTRAFPLSVAIVAGFYSQYSCIIENSQADFNSLGTANVAELVMGIGLQSPNAPSDGAKISGCTSNNNTGGSTGYGYYIDAFKFVDIKNCQGNSNGSTGLGIGIQIGTTPSTPVDKITAVDSVFDFNGTNGRGAQGILIQGGTQRNARNILIKGCQVCDTTSSTLSAVGIIALNADNVVIEDTNIYTTNGLPASFGIQFQSMRNSKIIRTQVHDIPGVGISIEGTNTAVSIIECLAMGNLRGIRFAPGSTNSCCLVQDSRAINNATTGFDYAGVTPLTTTFIGNEAQCNGGNDYFGLTGLINIQNLSWTNGTITNVNGGAAPGARFTNIIAGP